MYVCNTIDSLCIIINEVKLPVAVRNIPRAVQTCRQARVTWYISHEFLCPVKSAFLTHGTRFATPFVFFNLHTVNS